MRQSNKSKLFGSDFAILMLQYDTLIVKYLVNVATRMGAFYNTGRVHNTEGFSWKQTILFMHLQMNQCEFPQVLDHNYCTLPPVSK